MFLCNTNIVACDISVFWELKHQLVDLKLSVFNLALQILTYQLVLVILLPEHLILGDPAGNGETFLCGERSIKYSF